MRTGAEALHAGFSMGIFGSVGMEHAAGAGCARWKIQLMHQEGTPTSLSAFLFPLFFFSLLKHWLMHLGRN